MLVDAGADLNRENKSGTSARDMSAKQVKGKMEASSSQINDKMTSKLQGLAQLQRNLTQAPVLLRPWHDMVPDMFRDMVPDMVRDTSLAGANSIF